MSRLYRIWLAVKPWVWDFNSFMEYARAALICMIFSLPMSFYHVFYLGKGKLQGDEWYFWVTLGLALAVTIWVNHRAEKKRKEALNAGSKNSNEERV